MKKKDLKKLPTPVYGAINKLLAMSKIIENDYDLWSAWLKCIASGLYLEHKFKDTFESLTGTSRKDVFANLGELPNIPLEQWERVDILKWCSDTYDVYHPLRNSIETLDSIEEVRLFLEPLKDKNIGLHNLLD